MSSHPIVELTEAALAGLGADLPPSTDVEIEFVAVVVEKAGDALRAGIGLPGSLSNWLRRLSEEALASVLAASLDTLNDVGLPGAPSEIEVLEVAAVARDRSESVVAAVRRACIGAGRAAGTVEGFVKVTEAQASFDERLVKHVARVHVEAALGIRRGLLGAGSWTAALPETEASETETAGDESPSPDLAGAPVSDAGEPSSSAVVQYIQHGHVAKWVQGYAAAHDHFASQLLATVTAFRETGETVSFVARAWQAERERAPSRADAGTVTTIVRYGVSLALAAADEDVASETKRIRLGKLSPTDAEARLIVRGSRLTLRVLADQDSLRAVRFGGQEVPSTEAEVWSLDVPWTSEPLLLIVEDDAGRRFEGRLTVEQGPDVP